MKQKSVFLPLLSFYEEYYIVWKMMVAFFPRETTLIQ